MKEENHHDEYLAVPGEGLPVRLQGHQGGVQRRAFVTIHKCLGLADSQHERDHLREQISPAYWASMRGRARALSRRP
jgi:hypothetical protein